MKTMRTIAVATLLFAFYLVPSNVFASEIESSNEDTGSRSNNEINTSVENSTAVTNSNSAEISNNFHINVNTGDNSANDNTGDAEIKTGNIEGSVTVVNEGNVNHTQMPTSETAVTTNGHTEHHSGDVSISSSNSETGSKSNNEVNTKVEVTTDVVNKNKADVENNVTVDLNTGGNKANDNTGDAVIKTGDIEFDTDVENCLNRNFLNVHAKKDICNIGGIMKPPHEDDKEKPTKRHDKEDEDKDDEEEGSPTVEVETPTPIAMPTGQVLGASILPVTGTQTNFKLLLMSGALLLAVGLFLRFRANQSLATLYVRPQVRTRNKDSI